MFLKSLSLFQFRNYTHQRFTFSKDINFIYGSNAQGKSSLLEAIYFLIIGKSFRTKRTQQLIQFSCDYFAIHCHFENKGLVHELKVLSNGYKRQVWLNGTICKSFYEIFGLLKGVVLYPEDYFLVAGPPAIRRKYLDIPLAQSSSKYLQILRRYQEALKQKNAALKLKNTTTLPLWEEEMARCGAHLILKRKECLKQLQRDASHFLKDITSSEEELSFHYQSPCPTNVTEKDLEKHLKDLFLKQRTSELKMGCSLVGPHKDEIKISINEKCAKTYGSEGQQRTLAACLRLAEWKYLKQSSSCTPLMIIDDMDISLDAQRKEKLIKKMESLGQVFITSPYSPKDFSFTKQSKSFAIKKGALCASSSNTLHTKTKSTKN